MLTIAQVKVEPILHRNAPYSSVQCRNIKSVAVMVPEVPSSDDKHECVGACECVCVCVVGRLGAT